MQARVFDCGGHSVYLGCVLGRAGVLAGLRKIRRYVSMLNSPTPMVVRMTSNQELLMSISLRDLMAANRLTSSRRSKNVTLPEALMNERYKEGNRKRALNKESVRFAAQAPRPNF